MVGRYMGIRVRRTNSALPFCQGSGTVAPQAYTSGNHEASSAARIGARLGHVAPTRTAQVRFGE